MKTHYSKNKHCKCGKLISNNATRCSHCAKIGKLNHHFLNHPKIHCIDCNKELNKRAFYLKQKRCGSCARKELLKDPTNHPNYRDGSSFEKYPQEFNDKLRESIRKRDNYTCQNCGMTEEEHLIVIGKILEVHHIDYNKQNCKEENLIALCCGCNTRANYNRDYWQKIYINKINDLQREIGGK